MEAVFRLFPYVRFYCFFSHGAGNFFRWAPLVFQVHAAVRTYYFTYDLQKYACCRFWRACFSAFLPWPLPRTHTHTLTLTLTHTHSHSHSLSLRQPEV